MSYLGLDSGYQSLLNLSNTNTDIVTSSTITVMNDLILGYVPTNAVLLTDRKSNVIGKTLSAGTVLMGTSSGPVAGTINPTALQTTVTTGSSSITIGTIQNIDITSTPTFSGLTLTGIPSSILSTNASGVVQADVLAISNANGTSGAWNGSTLNLNMTQNLTTTGNPTFSNLTVTGDLITLGTGHTTLRQIPGTGSRFVDSAGNYLQVGAGSVFDIKKRT